MPQSKDSTPAQLVPLSMPQLVPVSSISASSSLSFPQVVSATAPLSIPSTGVPYQILTSPPGGSGGVTQGPFRINQLGPIQNVTPQIIRLPSASPGTFKFE